MKKKQEQPENNEHDLEIVKAVAQAWHGHSTSSKSSASNEFDAHRLNFKTKPTRFKLEAMNKLSSGKHNGSGASWDFGQSLWDSYEIVTVSKRLEAGLVLDHQFPDEASGTFGKTRSRRKLESKNSLRNILNRVSSRRFDDT